MPDFGHSVVNVQVEDACFQPYTIVESLDSNRP